MSTKVTQSANALSQHDGVDKSLVEKVWHALNKEVPREQVHRVVAQIALKYRDAPVQAFVPILIHRQAIDQLRPSPIIKNSPATDLVPANLGQRRNTVTAAKPINHKPKNGLVKMKKLSRLLHLSLLLTLLAACSGATAVQTTSTSTTTTTTTSVVDEVAATAVPVTISYDSEDLETSVDNATATTISLAGDAISVTGEGAVAQGSSVTITAAGTYTLSGTLNDGQIIVETDAEDAVVLILNGVNITNATNAPIYVSNADKVVITLADGTENVVSDGDTYLFAGAAATDAASAEPNAAIFSKADLTINGSGSLTVNANYNNGIVSKDDLKIVSGTITVTAVNDGIKGRDSIAVKDGIITINAGGDGMQANNDEDAEQGYIAIEGGSITINAELDGVQAETSLQISGGTINVTTNSAKGLKAGVDLTVSGGTIAINSADDALHSNGTLTISGGLFTLASGDDGMHADATLTINDGTVAILSSYEGLEATNVIVNGGTIDIASSDDGLNGAGGNDAGTSGSTNGFGMDNFSSSQGSITINGGTITIAAAGSGNGDGLDANGTITITGGDTVVKTPSSYRDYSDIDYDTGFSLTGGSVRILNADGTYTQVTDSYVSQGPGGGGGRPGRP